jgi:phytoene/squalene synthetase
VTAGASAADAYAHCASITRARAANFYYGIRLLPHDRRRGMCAVYAFARRIDDIGDGTLEPAEKLRRLDAEAETLSELELADREPLWSDDPVMLALADTYERFALPPGALGELIEGVRMDVNGVSYERFEDLVLYCRRVAGAIGRVCLPIFGARNEVSTAGPEAETLADDLGVAMQLTNILRDVREDAENGRVYLPASCSPSTARLRRCSSRCCAAYRAPMATRPTGPSSSDCMRSCASRPIARINGSIAGWSSRRCSTGAAPRACRPWPASTAGSSIASRRTPSGRWAPASRCRRRRRPGWRSAACSAGALEAP